MPNTENAVLMTYKLSSWGGEQLDRTISAEIKAAHNMREDTGDFRKKLVTKEFLANVSKIDSQIVQAIYRWTFATGATSLRILPNDARPELETVLADLKEKRIDALNATLDGGYELQKELGRERLGDAFKESDYPSIDDIKTRFKVKTTYLPMPAPEKTGIEDKDLKAAVAEARREAVEGAQQEAWTRLYSTCESFVARLKNYHEKVEAGDKTKYHETIVGSVKDLVESLEHMNIFGDAKLDAALRILKSEIASVAPETLKNGEADRLKAIDAAMSVINGAFPSEEKKPEQIPEPTKPEPDPAKIKTNPAKDFDIKDLF